MGLERKSCGDIFLELAEERQFAEHRMVSQTQSLMVHRWRQGVSVCVWCERMRYNAVQAQVENVKGGRT